MRDEVRERRRENSFKCARMVFEWGEQWREFRIDKSESR